MAAALRFFGRNRFLLSTKRKPLMIQSSYFRFEKDGWEFTLDKCPPPDCGRLDHRRLYELGEKMSAVYENGYFFINHLDSGIRFSFNVYDAVRKWVEEKSTLNPFHSDWPSYGSILFPVFDNQYDSAYVGRVLIEKPGEQPRYINPKWELIDWKTLHEQIVWTANNEQISSIPISLAYADGDGPATFVYKKRKSNQNRTNGNGLLNTQVNFLKPLYFDDNAPRERGTSSCNLYLVVTECGWFVYLYQFFSNCFGDKRMREMTMHCKFEQNIIYREIMERQSKDFEKRLAQVHKGMEKRQDDEMCVQFHEVKQLNIQDAYMGGSSSCTTGGAIARRYISFSVGEWKRAPLGVLDVSDDKIESLFANCGEQILSMEKETGTRIQIIPCFRHPYNPKVKLEKIPGKPPIKVPRRAYIHGPKNGIVSAKSRIMMMSSPSLTD